MAKEILRFKNYKEMRSYFKTGGFEKLEPIEEVKRDEVRPSRPSEDTAERDTSEE